MLFSTFSRQLREGTLNPPTEKGKDRGDEGDNEETQPVVEEVNIDKVTIDEDDNIYYVDLSKEVQEVMSLVSDWDIDNYVAVRYESLWYPGKIIGVNEDDLFEISCFEYVDTFERSNKFRWPARKDIKSYDRDDLLLKLESDYSTIHFLMIISMTLEKFYVWFSVEFLLFQILCL